MSALDLLYVGSERGSAADLVDIDVSYRVSLVSNQEAALSMLETTAFDGILLDYPQNEGDTRQFLEEAHRRTTDISVILAVYGDEPVELPDDLYDAIHHVDGETFDPADVSEAVSDAVTIAAATMTDGSHMASPSPVNSGVDSVPVEEGSFHDTVFDSLGDIVFLADGDGNLLRWNDRLNVVTGDTDAEISRRDAASFFVDADAEKVQETLDRVVTMGEVTSTVQLRTQDGTEIPYEVTASLVESDEDRPCICGVARDVTEQRQAQEQLDEAVRELERSNAELEQFAYAASHDMKEPLRMISSYLELLDKRYSDELDDDAQEFVGFASEGADRMREMINGLLAYSRVGRQETNFVEVDTNETLETALTNLHVAIEESDADIVAQDLPPVEADEGQLTQVFQNLVANAIKYTADGERPTVRISVDREGDEWVFGVDDDAVGIPTEKQEDIFDIFSRASENSGSGLGLAICKKIVERHGGDMWVDSEPGSGSTFYFTLPVVE